MKIEVGKTYETRYGKLFRVLCTDAKGTYPVVVLGEGVSDDFPVMMTASGRYYLDDEEHDYDLVREHVPLTYRWHRVLKSRELGLAWAVTPIVNLTDLGLVKLAFDPSGNLVIDKCEITGAQPNG